MSDAGEALQVNLGVNIVMINLEQIALHETFVSGNAEAQADVTVFVMLKTHFQDLLPRHEGKSVKSNQTKLPI